MHGQYVAFHLAGFSDLDEARDKPLETVMLKVEGTVKTLEAARNAGVKRFMYASTAYVYSRQGSFYRWSKPDVHYSQTPFAYVPKQGRKLSSNDYVELGEGILQVIAEVAHEADQVTPTEVR